MLIEEIEVGPHFLTFYSRDRTGLVTDLPAIYRAFMKKPDFESLKDYQQEGFIHVTNDPKVYHPYGDPIDFRGPISHFHIRTVEEPTNELIAALIAFTELYGASYVKPVPITYLGSRRTTETLNLKYPERGTDEDYFKYIERIRSTHGKYSN